MPFDAFFLTAVRRELEGSLTGCRIDKVQQPQRDTLTPMCWVIPPASPLATWALRI